jgi:hypothetical protein
MMLVEHKTFPAQFLSKLDLLENLPVVSVIAGIDVREIRRQYIDIETHPMLAPWYSRFAAAPGKAVLYGVKRPGVIAQDLLLDRG